MKGIDLSQKIRPESCLSMLFGTGLAPRIAFAASAFTLIFVLVLGGASYYVTRAQIIRDVGAHLENETALHAERITGRLSAVVTTLSPLTRNTVVINSLMDSLARQTALVPLLKGLSRINDIAVAIAVTDFEGTPLTEPHHLGLPRGHWKDEVLDKGVPYAEIRGTPGSRELWIAEPISYLDPVVPDGALIYKIALERVLQVGDEGGPSPHRARLLSRGQPLEPTTDSDEAAGDLDPRLVRTRKLDVPAVLAPLDLAVQVFVSQETVDRPLRRLLYAYALAGTIAVVLVLFLSTVGARYLTRPLRELEAIATSVVESGSFSHDFSVRGGGEICRLGDAFNRMLERLGGAYHELALKAKEEAARSQQLADINRALQREIGERKQAEENQRAAQEMLQQVINTIPHFVSWKDRESRYLGCNNRFLRSAGLRRAEDVVLKADHQLPWRDQAELYRADDRQVIESETAKYNYEELRTTIDGRQIWLETSKVPLRNGCGEVVGILSISQDITERKHSQEGQRQAAVVIESTQEGIMITDAQGGIIRVNPAFTEITGYAAADVLGQTPRILKSGRHDPAFYQVMWESLQRTGRWQGEIWNRRKTGEVYPEWLTISSVRDDQGKVVNYAAVFSDISQLKVSQEKLEHLAHHDPLTGLPNRLLFRDRLEHAMQRADRGGKALAVLFMDLDRFKHVNDSLGHTVGDAVLEAVATRLEGAVRRDDTLARLGGDEFTVLVEGVAEADDPAHLATKLNRVLRKPFRVQGHELFLGASIGISLYPQDAQSGEALLRNADTAMYHAKEAGRNTFRFYSQEMTTRALERVVLEGQLKRAIDQGELVLHYQPQVDLADHRLVGVEALVRWNHPQQGLLPPARFVAIAEESELIIALGDWVLRTACRQAKTWLDAGIDFGRIAVNVAGRQILQGGLKESVQRVLAETGLPPQRLELEIAETFMMQHPKQNVELLLAVRELGVALAIDDFGTGYSSLAYLKQLPVDKLKLDRSFVHGLPNDGDDAAIARAVIALGRSLQFKVMAEGLETEAQRAFLQAEHCEQAQGFLWSHPLAADQLLPVITRLCRDR